MPTSTMEGFTANTTTMPAVEEVRLGGVRAVIVGLFRNRQDRVVRVISIHMGHMEEEVLGRRGIVMEDILMGMDISTKFFYKDVVGCVGIDLF